MLGLLRTCALNKPLMVAVNGRVIEAANPGFGTHDVPGVGVVTSIKPHRFHGLVEATPTFNADPWWQTEEGLVARERGAMSRAFPEFVEIVKYGRWGWQGMLTPWMTTFEVQVLHWGDRRYLPTVIVVNPQRLGRHQGGRFVRPKHLYNAGNLCVARTEDWTPDADDAVTVVAWTAHWLACYDQWRAFGGAWPRAGYVVGSN